MKIKHTVITNVELDDLFSMESIKIWMDPDIFLPESMLEAYRKSIIQAKINIWIANNGGDLESSVKFKSTFYFGLYHKMIVVK